MLSAQFRPFFDIFSDLRIGPIFTAILFNIEAWYYINIITYHAFKVLKLLFSRDLSCQKMICAKFYIFSFCIPSMSTKFRIFKRRTFCRLRYYERGAVDSRIRVGNATLRGYIIEAVS